MYMLLAYLSGASTIIPLAAFFYSTGWRNATLAAVCLLLLNSLAFDVLSLLHRQSGGSNLSLINLYVYIEFWLCLLIFVSFWRERKLFLYSILSIGVLSVVCLGTGIFNGKVWGVSWLENGISAAVISLVSIRSYYKLMTQRTRIRLTHHYFFWINLACLLYFTGNLTIFIFKEWIQINRPELWGIHNTLHIVFNIALTVGLIKWKKSRLSDSYLQVLQ